jgi:hypothetical protein
MTLAIPRPVQLVVGSNLQELRETVVDDHLPKAVLFNLARGCYLLDRNS